jgi:hypothetical protein
MWTARVLLAAVLVVCVTSSADAWRRHRGSYGDGERASVRSLDEWRARQAQGQNNEQGQNRDQARGDDRGQDGAQSRAENPDRWQDRYRDRYDRRRARYDEWRRAREDRRRYRDEDLSRSRAAERGDVARGRSGPFGATIDKLVRGCAVQAAEFENWPLDAISRTVGADETQRKALEGLRDAAKQAAQRLSTECPQDVPAAPAARLEAAEQGIAAALTAFDTVEPKLQAFYAALNDEQKARLYREMAAPAPPAAVNAAATTGAREAREERRYSSRRDRWRAYAEARERMGSPHEPEARLRASSTRYGDMRDSRMSLRSSGLRSNATAAAPGWSGTCEELGSVLRNWSVREIERDVRLAGAQRVALYELVTTSLKAAETLSSACPAEAALTPVGRMETMRKRLTAVRAATAAIRPALARFYEALDQGQKVRFAGMS